MCNTCKVYDSIGVSRVLGSFGVLHQPPNICAIILQINCNAARVARWGDALCAVSCGREVEQSG